MRWPVTDWQVFPSTRRVMEPLHVWGVKLWSKIWTEMSADEVSITPGRTSQQKNYLCKHLHFWKKPLKYCNKTAQQQCSWKTFIWCLHLNRHVVKGLIHFKHLCQNPKSKEQQKCFDFFQRPAGRDLNIGFVKPHSYHIKTLTSHDWNIKVKRCVLLDGRWLSEVKWHCFVH